MKRSSTVLLSFLLLFFLSACNAQENTVDRQPSAAGQFYPANPTDLENTLTSLFSQARHLENPRNIVAIIVPHAGYAYSGEVAASGFAQIDHEKHYDNVFIIGPSHHIGFDGAAVYTSGDYITPLGKVEVNRALGRDLARREPLFSDRTDAQLQEHSVEVQIPFLQHLLKQHLRIVPIVVGSSSPQTCMRLGKALRPFFTKQNLFVISSDFSHYPSYDDAVLVDRATAGAIVANSPERLLSALRANEERGVPNLETSLCGSSAVLTFLSMSSTADAVFTPVEYRNSGDAASGDKQRVVGYWSIAVALKERTESFVLANDDKRALLRIARQTITEYLAQQGVPSIDASALSPAVQMPCGAFVTLTKHRQLRGCIGRFEATEPLYKIVQEMAVAAATQDSRFEPVQSSELRDIDVEISVLTPMRRIQSIDEFELGKHGIYMKKGGHSGTFLPQVAKETGWSKEEFLGHCAEDKAGIGWSGWKDAELYVYDALVFGEK